MSKEDTLSLVPNQRFPEFIGDGPWRLCETRDFLNESRNPSGENNPSRRITVRLNLRGVEHRAYRGTESTEATNHFRRNAGQFIYGKQNIHKGAFGIIPEQLHGYETSQDLPCFDFNGRCSPQWLFYHFARDDIYLPLELKMTGTGSKRLNEKTFLSLAVPAPSYIEQQKIADCLSSLDELIAAQARKVESLKTHKKGLMQQLFPREGETQPRLRFPEFRDAGEWDVRALSSFSKVGDIDHKMPLSVIDGIPYIMTGNFFGMNGIDFDNAKKVSTKDYEQLIKKIKPEFGDIVIARYASVGAVRYIETKSKFLVSYSCAIVKCNGSEDSKYLYYIFQSGVIQSKIGLEINASSQKNIGIDSIKRLNIFLPTLPEQQKISDCLTTLDALITTATQELEALKTHKKGLMQQLFPQGEALS